MALALTVESLDAIDEPLRSLYVERDGAFHLDADIPDTGALKRAKDHEKAGRQAAEKQARELADQLAAIQKQLEDDKENSHRKSGDVEALDKSWQEKFAKITGEKDSHISTLTNMVNSLTAGQAAQDMARELAVEGGEAALYQLIRGRFGVDMKDGAAVAVALTADGKNSALTMDELRAELKSDKNLAALVAGSKAAGGGTAGSRGGSATPPAGKKPADMTAAEKSSFIAEHGLEAWQKLLNR